MRKGGVPPSPHGSASRRQQDAPARQNHQAYRGAIVRQAVPCISYTSKFPCRHFVYRHASVDEKRKHVTVVSSCSQYTEREDLNVLFPRAFLDLGHGAIP